MAQKETVKTSKPLNTEAPSSGKLQRLGFIPAYSSLAYGYVSSAYDSAKGYIPAGLKPQLESAEKLYNKNVQPIVAKFTDGGQEILLVLDNRVRACVLSVLCLCRASSLVQGSLGSALRQR